MKNKGILLVLTLALVLFTSCSTEVEESSSFPIIKFDHFSSGGVSEEYEAVILFEQSNSTFTSYQVAFLSCNCRDALVSYFSVMYVELLNSKENVEDSAIRSITFGNNQGLWGDSNPNYYVPEYTEEYYDEHFVQKLVKATKSDIDSWAGYGESIEPIGVDLIAGATVSTSNITSMLQSLFEYHEENYYS